MKEPNLKAIWPYVSKVLKLSSRSGCPAPKISSKDIQNRNYSSDKPDKPAKESKEDTTGVGLKGPGLGLTKFGLAQEEGYFYNKDKESLQKIRKDLQEKNVKPKGKPNK